MTLVIVRVFYYSEGEYEGCVDLPGNCSVRTAVRSMVSRGWVEVLGDGFGNGSGRAKLKNDYGEAIIETVDGNIHGTSIPNAGVSTSIL